MQWPAGVTGLIDYVTVDPSAGNFWGVEWWAIQPETKVRYLIRGLRSSRFRVGDLLQSDTSNGDLTGLMQDWQAQSTSHGHPTRVWVIKGNSAFKHLTQYDHIHTWQRRWGCGVILHQTSRNKHDEQTDVEALVPTLYRQGLKRLPRRHSDLEALGFVTKFAKQLTQYPTPQRRISCTSTCRRTTSRSGSATTSARSSAASPVAIPRTMGSIGPSFITRTSLRTQKRYERRGATPELALSLEVTNAGERFTELLDNSPQAQFLEDAVQEDTIAGRPADGRGRDELSRRIATRSNLGVAAYGPAAGSDCVGFKAK